MMQFMVQGRLMRQVKDLVKNRLEMFFNADVEGEGEITSTSSEASTSTSSSENSP